MKNVLINFHWDWSSFFVRTAHFRFPTVLSWYQHCTAFHHMWSSSLKKGFLLCRKQTIFSVPFSRRSYRPLFRLRAVVHGVLLIFHGNEITLKRFSQSALTGNYAGKQFVVFHGSNFLCVVNVILIGKGQIVLSLSSLWSWRVVADVGVCRWQCTV